MSIIHGIRTLGQPRCTWCRQNGIRDCTYGTAAREDIDTTLKRGMNLIRVEGIVDATVSWRCKNCFIYGNWHIEPISSQSVLFVGDSTSLSFWSPFIRVWVVLKDVLPSSTPTRASLVHSQTSNGMPHSRNGILSQSKCLQVCWICNNALVLAQGEGWSNFILSQGDAKTVELTIGGRPNLIKSWAL